MGGLKSVWKGDIHLRRDLSAQGEAGESKRSIFVRPGSVLSVGWHRIFRATMPRTCSDPRRVSSRAGSRSHSPVKVGRANDVVGASVRRTPGVDEDGVALAHYSYAAFIVLRFRSLCLAWFCCSASCVIFVFGILRDTMTRYDGAIRRWEGRQRGERRGLACVFDRCG